MGYSLAACKESHKTEVLTLPFHASYSSFKLFPALFPGHARGGAVKCVCDVSALRANPPSRQALAYLHGLPFIGSLSKPGPPNYLKSPRSINKEMRGGQAMMSSRRSSSRS